jgi:ribosome-binding protein aMBF1 (putative translation factor)
MLCSLCSRDADQVIRVDGWQVCQWCISNKVLEHAIEVRSNVKKLTTAVASARIKHQEDSNQVREARDKLERIYEDLSTAITKLAVLNEDSQNSLAESLAAFDALKEYRDTESGKTHDARKGTS